jgi:AAA domain
MPTMENANLDALYCMFTGEWGTRKSTQALSFPTPQYWFSWDQKMEGIYLPMKLWGVDPKLITYDDYNDWNKAEEKLKRMQVECPYKTIVIDSITSCGDYINAQTLKLKSGTTRNTGEEAGKRIAGIPVNTQEDFNAETSALQTLVRLTKDIHKFHKVNVILIAHVIRTDEKGNVARTIVTGGRKIAAKMPGYCHEIYHFFMKGEFNNEKQYAIHTTHTREDFARTSLPLAPEIILGDNPLYPNYLVPGIKKLREMGRTLPQKF